MSVVTGQQVTKSALTVETNEQSIKVRHVLSVETNEEWIRMIKVCTVLPVKTNEECIKWICQLFFSSANWNIVNSASRWSKYVFVLMVETKEKNSVSSLSKYSLNYSASWDLLKMHQVGQLRVCIVLPVETSGNASSWSRCKKCCSAGWNYRIVHQLIHSIYCPAGWN
jgi:hypothetical protein